jgi:hypothetical protein
MISGTANLMVLCDVAAGAYVDVGSVVAIGDEVLFAIVLVAAAKQCRGEGYKKEEFFHSIEFSVILSNCKDMRPAGARALQIT